MSSQNESLIRMANQIAAFFRTQPGDDAAGHVAAHLSDFWEPGMRARLRALARAGTPGIDEVVVQAVTAEPGPAATDHPPSG